MDQSTAAKESIAIVGMACVYPGAQSPDELWENVLAGRRYFREAPAERLPPEYFDTRDPGAPGKSYCDKMAVITGWRFDPLEFHLPPVSIHASDVAHWIALATANAAIRDANLNLNSIDRTRVGVILGNTMTGEFSRSHVLRHRWPYVARSLRRALGASGYASEQCEALIESVRSVYEAPLPDITEDSLAGNMSNTIVGRVCNHFDLGGGGYTVDGACSSSLLAVAHACKALIDRDMDVALAGGVDISLDPFEVVGFAKAKALASDDIRPYDASAGGMLPGEGCGVVVLMREADAHAAGHPIHALIRGWGYSTDGKGSITAPNVEGQMRALSRAYHQAGYSIADVGLIEGHGTGTKLGDQVEITAILRLLEAEARTRGEDTEAVRIGSIKGNIGHCKAAAGMAGLIKATMALKRKVLPPTLNCRQPNPAFGKSLARLRPTIAGQAWESGKAPRRASVSSMGFGGANSHVTLEEANPHDVASAEDLGLTASTQATELVLISAATIDALRARIFQLIPLAARICRAELTDLAAALAARPQAGPFRIAIVAESPWQLRDVLQRASEKLAEGRGLDALDDPRSGVFAGVALEQPVLVALFPGQGSQRLNMGDALLRRYPFVRDLYARVDGELRELTPGGLQTRIFRDLWSADENLAAAWDAELRATEIAQPSIVLSSLAMLRVLEFLGLKPQASIGHSLGEISALCAAGAYDAPTAVRLAALRGGCMASLALSDPGCMAALEASAEDVKRLADPYEGRVVVSNYNAPRQTVVSGTSDAIERLMTACKALGVRCRPLPVSHAFHSPIVAPAAEAFAEALETFRFQPLSGSVASTATGTWLDPEADLRALLANHIRQPVRFTDAIETARQLRPTLWVEVGPGTVLSGLARQTLTGVSSDCFSTDVAGEDTYTLLNRICARAFVCGLPLAADRVFAHRFVRPFDVDHYDPVFIVNPCERPVDLTALSLQPIPSTIPAGLMPPEASEAAFGDYLARRGPFLRDLIALDYRHNGGAAAPCNIDRNAADEISGGPNVVAASHEHPEEESSVLSFAIEWIAQRTGFPKDSITPDMRLRDDLNLDSIKSGELLVILAKKINAEVELDPAVFGNAKLGDFTEILGRMVAGGASAAAANRRSAHFTQAPGIDTWTRTFVVRTTPAALAEGAQDPLGNGHAVVIGDPQSPHSQAIASRLRADGLTVRITDAGSLASGGDAPADLGVVVTLLSPATAAFWSCTPEEFDARIEGELKTLFRVFRWAGNRQSTAQSGLRAIVLRPVPAGSDCGTDLDAGAGFLKSLALEHKDMQLKWVALPRTWEPERWAEVCAAELERREDNIAFTYAVDGRRLRQVAVPMETGAVARPALGTGDVVLVTGGAKGITCELALGLARATGATLALLGSSPAPDPESDASTDEILRNLGRFGSADVRCRYWQCDVTDAAAVRTVVEQVERELGPVTGILHGAGVTKFQLFRAAEWEDYLRCVRIKARGLYNLLAAVHPERLKAVHATASVLGHTGMRSQADYAFANAWLDGALAQLKTSHPHVQVLSVGYSVWAEAGIGKKFGTIDSLRSVGVAAVETQDGVDAYVNLLKTEASDSTFVVTGRLSTDLERTLFGFMEEAPRPRFLERIRRWAPGTELVADATLAHETDLYLAEHVFEGTPLFPGVMALEAMVEGAMACTGRTDLPVLRNIRFRHPLIVPADATVVMRTLALADPPDGKTLRVRVAIKSDGDTFTRDHFTADCIFGAEPAAAVDLPRCPEKCVPLPKNPEDFAPVPLFQGKFFRRITAIRRLEEDTALTDVQVPVGERYYGVAFDLPPVMPSPAVRDAFLQSGAIALPAGNLPVAIDELRVRRPTYSGTLLCEARVQDRTNEGSLVEMAVFAEDGTLVETIRGLRLEASGTTQRNVSRDARPSMSPREVSDELERVWKDPHALSVVEYAELPDLSSTYDAALEAPEIRCGEIQHIVDSVAAPRRVAAVANLVAARRAAVTFARNVHGADLDPRDISLDKRSDGKPLLRFDRAETAALFAGVDVSVADNHEVSFALVGPAPVGIDIEIVEPRDAEMWRALLHDDGYALAREIALGEGESLDQAATRIWTLGEAGKKANDLNDVEPRFERSCGGPWLSFSADTKSGPLRMMSAIVDRNGTGALLAFTAATPREASHAKNGRNAVDASAQREATRVCEASPRAVAVLTQTNRAWRFSRFGAENLRLETVPVRGPGRGEVLVQVGALSLNYRDHLILNGKYSPTLRLPAVPLSDAAGTVVAVGHGVNGWCEGDEVVLNVIVPWTEGPYQEHFPRFSLGLHRGVAAEWLCVPAESLVRLPDGYSQLEACTLPVAALAAWAALVKHGNLQPGQTALVLGTGGVSVFALQIARALGASVLMGSSSPEKRVKVQQLGASLTFDYRETPDWETVALNATNGTGVDITLDTGGGGTLSRSTRATKAGGTVVCLGAIAGPDATINVPTVMLREQRLVGVYTGSRADFLKMLGFFVKHDIHPVIDRMFAFDDLPGALRYSASGQHVGKVVVEVTRQPFPKSAARRVSVSVGKSGQSPPKIETTPRSTSQVGVAATNQNDASDAAAALVEPAAENGRLTTFRFEFVVPFSDGCSVSRRVPFYRLIEWMGKAREASAVGCRDELLPALREGTWGLVTTEQDVRVYGEVAALDNVRVCTWMNGPRQMDFLVERLGRDGTSSVVAEGYNRFASVAVVGHGKVVPSNGPLFFESFLRSISAATNACPRATPPKTELPKLARLRWESPYPEAHRRVLQADRITPTTADSNVVGNVWFGNYFKWQARLIDLFLHRVNPDYLRQIGRSGELLVRSSKMTYFNESMPLDEIEARLFVTAQYDNGVRFGIDYFKIIQGADPIKLSVGEIEAVWVECHGDGLSVSSPMPADIVEAIGTPAHGKRFTGRRPSAVAAGFKEREVRVDLDPTGSIVMSAMEK